MPIVLWDKLCETSDLKYLVINGEIDERAISIYDKIQSEIIDVFGISEQLLKVIRKKIELEKLYFKLLIKNEKTVQLQINHLEAEIEQLEKQNKQGNDIHLSIMSIEKFQGVKLDFKTLTIREYYNYSLFIKKQNESIKQGN